MTSKIVVNNIEADSGINTVTFNSNIQGNLIGNVTGAVNSSGIATFSNGIVVAAGTTAAPSISPSGDSNTGIFFPSADTIAFGEGGIEAARIDSSGNLGINSTSPGRKLDVVDSGANGSVVRSRVTTNNGGYFAYEALNSSGTSVFSVTHNGRINLSENIVFASGQGLDFSATANGSGSVSSEVLDDYEIGSWTPTLTFGGGATGLTYARQFGRYVKIGNYVQVVGHFQISTVGSSTGSAVVGGLPFNYGAITGGYFVPMGVRGGLNVSGLPSVSFYVSSGGGSTLPIYVCGTSGGGNATVGHTAFATNTEIDICVSYYI